MWPEKHLPQLRPVFQKLGQMMADVGEQIAALCDEYMRQKVGHITICIQTCLSCP